MSFTSVLTTRPNASKARLPALYADFRPLKHNNPEGYAANIQVWQSALSHAISQNTLANNDSILVLDITSQFLGDISISPYGRPLGITSVMVSLIKLARGGNRLGREFAGEAVDSVGRLFE